MRLIYSIKLELLFDSRIRIERVNLFELKLNSSITLKKPIYNLINCANKNKFVVRIARIFELLKIYLIRASIIN